MHRNKPRNSTWIDNWKIRRNPLRSGKHMLITATKMPKAGGRILNYSSCLRRFFRWAAGLISLTIVVAFANFCLPAGKLFAFHLLCHLPHSFCLLLLSFFCLCPAKVNALALALAPNANGPQAWICMDRKVAAVVVVVAAAVACLGVWVCCSSDKDKPPFSREAAKPKSCDRFSAIVFQLVY